MINKALNGAKELFPICIPSYKRWDKKENKTLSGIIAKCEKDIQKKTYVFVRAEQEKNYATAFKDICNIVVLPKVNGLSSTRQYITEYVHDVLKEDYYIDMDDDITSLRYIYTDNGKQKTSTAKNTDYNQIFRLACEISKIAFTYHNCVLGGLHRQHFANSPNIAYVTNKGPTPRQFTIVNAKLMYEMQIKRDDMFDPTGDDVGFVAEISKKGGNFFNIPFLLYGFVDDALNSVIRTDENRRRLAAYEYECLLKYPMGKYYLRIPFRYEDGAYKFSDIDFTKYRKLTKKKTDTVQLYQICKINKWTEK